MAKEPGEPKSEGRELSDAQLEVKSIEEIIEKMDSYFVQMKDVAPGSEELRARWEKLAEMQQSLKEISNQVIGAYQKQTGESFFGEEEGE